MLLQFESCTPDDLIHDDDLTIANKLPQKRVSKSIRERIKDEIVAYREIHVLTPFVLMQPIIWWVLISVQVFLTQ